MSDMQAVGDAIAARLAALPGPVFRGLRKVDESMMPCTVLVEGSERVTDQVLVRAATAKSIAEYAVHRYLPCDPTNPNLAGYAARKDVLRAIYLTNGAPDGTLGRAVLGGLKYTACDIGPRADGAAFVAVMLAFEADVAEDLTK